jgi:hypothetical protein
MSLNWKTWIGTGTKVHVLVALVSGVPATPAASAALGLAAFDGFARTQKARVGTG